MVKLSGINILSDEEAPRCRESFFFVFARGDTCERGPCACPRGPASLRHRHLWCTHSLTVTRSSLYFPRSSDMVPVCGLSSGGSFLGSRTRTPRGRRLQENRIAVGRQLRFVLASVVQVHSPIHTTCVCLCKKTRYSSARTRIDKCVTVLRPTPSTKQYRHPIPKPPSWLR